METPRALRSVHGNLGEGRIPEKDFEEILGTCVLAANASKRRSYSIVVDDPGAQKELTGCKGSLTLVLCDDDRIIDVAERLGHADDVRGFPLFVAGMVGACLAAAAAIAAMGIDSAFANGIHRGDPERVDALLDPPKACSFPAVALVLGYADGKAAPTRGRLDGRDVVHRGAHRHLSADEIDALVVRHDDPAERLDLHVPWKAKGFVHFLDGFCQVWSNPVRHRAGSPDLLGVFVRAGFTKGTARPQNPSPR